MSEMVGLGTSSPSYKLDVTDTDSSVQAMFGKGRSNTESQILIGGGLSNDGLLIAGMDPVNGHAYLQTYGTDSGKGLNLKRSGTATAVGIGTTTPKTILHGTGSTIVGAATSAVSDANMGNGQVNFWVDETNHRLYFKVKYSGGSVKSGYMALS